MRFHEHIPFDLELAPEVRSLDDILYWKCANRTSLLEIKLVAATGMIGGATLVLVPRQWRRMVQSVRPTGLRADAGIPVVDLAPWKAMIGGRELFDWRQRFVDESATFVFAIGTDGVAVQFESGEAASMVTAGDLAFSFTEEDVLCGITLTGLSSRELRRMRKFHGP